ncbi:MAG TPA: hypothetical protein VIL16_30730 [Trebonia sp.]
MFGTIGRSWLQAAALRPVPLPLAQPPTSASRPPTQASSGEFR